MRTREPIVCTLLTILVSTLGISLGYAQRFTRVTDPGNPVVQDVFESGGGCWIDVNGDGYLDLFVAHGNLTSQNNSLYLNNRSGGFIKVTTGPVVNDGGSSIGGTFGDFNRDGFPDLFVTNRNNFGNFLYLGTGDTTFIKVTSGSPVNDIGNSNMSSWVDINNDGQLDLHVVNFQGDNFLYMNGGAPTFTLSRTDTGSIVSDGLAPSIVGLWGDVNNDRRPDLFVGRGTGGNDVLHINNGNGSFTPVLISDVRSTLGASWGDFDNDGNLDLFVAHYLGQTNQLYHNSGAPSFTLVPVDTGIITHDAGNWVGTAWGDYDNDGDLDLFVANDGGNSALYENLGPPSFAFRKVTGEPVSTNIGNSFGAVWGDYNRDGYLDLFVANRSNEQNFLYLNNGGTNGWLIIRCVGTISNTTAIGTRVHVKATVHGLPTWQLRDVQGQTGYNSQNLLVHFGLADATTVDSVIIEWPSGITTYHTNIVPSQYITAREDGSLTTTREEMGSVPSETRLLQNYPNPFNPSTTIRYSIPVATFVTVQVLDILGRKVALLERSQKPAGAHEVRFDPPSQLSGGVYFYELQAGAIRLSGRMVYVK